MFKMLIIAAAFVGGLLYFGVLDDAGEITEMLPEAAQRCPTRKATAGASSITSELVNFGVLDDAGEIVTEMLPEAAQRYSPSDAESDSRSPPQLLLSLSTPSFGQKRGGHITKVRLPLFMTGWGPGERDEKAPTQVNSDAIWTSVPA